MRKVYAADRAAQPPLRTEGYERVDSVPDGLTWKPAPEGSHNVLYVVLASLGNIYKLARHKETGVVTYYKLKDTGPEMRPKSAIDAEPAKPKRTRIESGSKAWFVDDGARWYLVEVEIRNMGGIYTLRSATGWDAERRAEWPFGEVFEFGHNSPLRERLKPLRARPL